MKDVSSVLLYYVFTILLFESVSDTNILGSSQSHNKIQRHKLKDHTKTCFIPPNVFYFHQPHEISTCVEQPKQMSEIQSAISQADEMQRQAADLAPSTALAVVPYKEENILPHERPNRTFHLAGRDFHIRQNWQDGGVAGVVWDAAVVLAEYLTDHASLVKGKKVLELGAGTGLTGMVAASLGANVVATERSEAIPHLESSIALNQGKGDLWSITAEVLDWTEDIDVSKWHDMDVVIGADIIYIEETFQDLLRTIKKVAPSPRTSVLLSCRIRYDRDTRFLKKLKKFYDIREIYYSSKMDVKIFSVVWKSDS